MNLGNLIQKYIENGYEEIVKFNNRLYYFSINLIPNSILNFT